MEKKSKKAFPPSEGLRKNWKKMKLTLILSLLVFVTFGNSYSQVTNLSLNLKNADIREVLQSIEEQTNYIFLYKDEIFDFSKKFSVDFENRNFKEILESICKQANVDYEIRNRQIVLKEKSVPGEVIQILKTISGKVTDSTGQALPGVTVVVKGTTNGIITDFDGKYSIGNIPPDGVLVFSFVGMKTQEIAVANKVAIDITMEEEAIGIEEVVAIGYGTVKKKDLTGGISTVAGEDIADRKISQVSRALQGATSGVMVTRGNGDPGTSASIRIRGVTTIGDSNPLIIVDGVPVSNIDQVNPNDIESVSVLKDAASASIYGSRAAAGVILLTTKRTKAGELSLNYDFNYGIEAPTGRPEVVDVTRYMQMNNELIWNDQGNTGDEYPVYTKNEVDNYYELNKQNPDQYPLTDWDNLMYKKSAPIQRHSLAISGGSNNVRIHGSLSYENTEGLYVHRNFERINSRLNTDIIIKENLLNAKMDFYFQRNIQERPIMSPANHYLTGPAYPAMWSNGSVSGGKSGDNPYGQLVYGGTNNSWGNTIGGKLEINFLPFDGLTITALVSPSLRFDSEKEFRKKIPYYDAGDPTQIVGYLSSFTRTYLSEVRNQNQNYTIQFLANYEKEIQGHSFNIMAGYEEYSSSTENMGASRDDFELTYFPYLSMGPLDFRDNYGEAYENAYRSYFGRMLYNYNDKYLLQANIRFDGSSRFHPDYRWAMFPSFSAGWVLSNESFLKDNDIISYLKLRGSYGTLGNERIGNYPYQATILFQQGILFFNGSNILSSTSAAQQKWAIPDITWEKTETYNIGLDVHFFDSKLQLTGDVYKKNTSNMLLALQIPAFMGYNNPDQNAGSMSTKGWDFEVSWRDNIGDLKYSVSANLFDSKSLMEDLSGTEFKGSQITAEGTEYQEWFGYKTDGLFQNQEEISNSAVISSAVKPGDVKLLDISGPEGVPDGKVSPDYDRVPLGGSLPRYQFGGKLGLGYKNFDFSMVIQGVAKRNIAYIDEIMPLQTYGSKNASTLYDGNYWSVYNTEEENLSAKYPRLSITSQDYNYTMSEHWISNGAYLRIKNINIGYSIPQHIVNKLNIQQLKVYVNISDLYSFDKLPKGYDPEARSSVYPITSTFMFGASVKF